MKEITKGQTYRFRCETRYSVPENLEITGHWTGEIDAFGKLTIETNGPTHYLFRDEIKSFRKAKPLPLTDERYVAKGGSICPFCGSTEIEGDGVEIDGPTATQEVSCGSCEATWFDTYALTGYFTVAPIDVPHDPNTSKRILDDVSRIVDEEKSRD